MTEFPRTMIEDLSVSRMIIGTNWFLGYSHTSWAKNNQINELVTADRIADILEVFFNAGIDTLMAPYGPQHPKLIEGIKDAEDRTGRRCIIIGTPTLRVTDEPAAFAENERVFDEQASMGVSICMPHTGCTDALVDVRSRRIIHMERYCAMIRQRGMIPGLSTHMPEAIVYADETDLDVGTYISIYNAIGFLMHVEVDWIQRLIWSAKHPVLTIKPMAAGRLMPLVGLAFAWSTIRDMDMVTVGTMTTDEAREVIDISRSILDRTGPAVPLQRTRSKESVERRV